MSDLGFDRTCLRSQIRIESNLRTTTLRFIWVGILLPRPACGWDVRGRGFRGFGGWIGLDEVDGR